MRLKTKLVLAATALTFAIVIVLSILFLSELLRQRVDETAAANQVLAREVSMMMQTAVADGLREHPPADGSRQALREAVRAALDGYPALNRTMDAFVRYSPTVEDVSITDSANMTLVSTDPQMSGRPAVPRMAFSRIVDAGAITQARVVFGHPQVLDVPVPLELNGRPFLSVHIGVRSTFLENNFVPWLRGAAFLAIVAGVISMLAAAMLTYVALRPIEEIGRRLDRLTEAGDEADAAPAGTVSSFSQLRPSSGSLTAARTDAVVRVSDTIARLDRQIRTAEAGYTDLQTNLNQMLDTLRDGVVLFTAERKAVMVSDAVAHFLGGARNGAAAPPGKGAGLVGRTLPEIFSAETTLGRAVLKAFDREAAVAGEVVRLEDGRDVEFSLARIDDARNGADAARGEARTGARMGTLLTLRDRGSALRLEQELEVSRRLAAVGRLTRGVGHEVKNPINAMVVHLELLRTKLEAAGKGRAFFEPVMRHVDILAGEMERLDRVVETLADFTRPLELNLDDLQLGEVVARVVELTEAEMAEHGVELRCDIEPAHVRGDGELLRQALLNLVLNGVQAMPSGGLLDIRVRRAGEEAVLEIEDHGEGIRPELMPRIFELYFTTKTKGSGIGLAMTYRLVQMHGGSISVASEPGQGARFTMRLPLAESMAMPLNGMRQAEAQAPGRMT